MHYLIFPIALACYWCVTIQHVSAASSPDIEELTVKVSRIERPLPEIPAAVSIIDGREIQRGRQQLGLDESLNRVPGLFFQNRYNFAQDLRISIRGFGARANFGLRGIKLYVDEIPATVADGQGGVDDIDIGSLQRIEVMRGPAASLYGSSAGGVINMFSEQGTEQGYLEARPAFGSFGYRKYQLKAGGQIDRLNYSINTSTLALDGYRDHSRLEHHLVNSRFGYEINDQSDVIIVMNAVDSPRADDPGGVTMLDAARNPKQAESRNVSSGAGEELTQQKLGMVYHRQLGEFSRLTLRNYYLWRDFTGFLPLGTHIPFVADDGVVSFDRFFYGGGAQISTVQFVFNRTNHLTAGIDVDMQKDDRQRFINNAGSKGEVSFDQLERAKSYGFFIRDELELTDSVRLVAGGRFDVVKLEIQDRYTFNGDQSSSLKFSEFSPTIGVVWMFNEQSSVYTNYASAFETPTFTELADPARSLNVNLGGFSNVTAQQAKSFELGARGSLTGALNYDFAIYSMSVDDEITSISNLGNRSFFENADTGRDGVEVALDYDSDGLQLHLAYTYARYRFEDFPGDPAVEGNNLPGLPRHQLFAGMAYVFDAGTEINWDLLLVDNLFADNANNVEVDGYTVSNLHVIHDFQLDNWTLSPFIGINNIFDKDYFANVRINAFGGRYFEPAPGRNAYGGINIRFNY